MQNPATTQAVVEKPTAAFALSLVAGLLALAGSGAVMTTSFPTGEQPYHYNGMMGGYYGGMMGGYYGMMHGAGFGGAWFLGLGAVGLVSGIVILIGAIMLYNKPAQASTWGTLVLVFSLVSFFGMGGFFLGGILGVVGGILALTWKGPG